MPFWRIRLRKEAEEFLAICVIAKGNKQPIQDLYAGISRVAAIGMDAQQTMLCFLSTKSLGQISAGLTKIGRPHRSIRVPLFSTTTRYIVLVQNLTGSEGAML